MTDKATQLIADFKEKKWKAPQVYERMFELAEDEESISRFTQQYLNTFPEEATVFNDALSYISKQHFEQLVTEALQLLKAGDNESAESVIHYASLQFPELLHPHLELIFELAPNVSAYYAEYPWRHLPPQKTEIFKAKLIHPQTSPADKQRLFNCLLETRDMEAVRFAYQYAQEHDFLERDNKDEYLAACLHLVGFCMQDNDIRSYCPVPVKHLCFQTNYFPAASAIQLSRTQHPTWRLPAGEQTYAFGGVLDNDAQNPFSHIVTFQPVPDWLPVTGLPQLCLGAHFNEVNETDAVFYQHDSNGMPVKLNLHQSAEPQYFIDPPLAATRVALAETPARWAFQSWGSANGRENLFRVGGTPSWIQDAEVLTCPVCNEKMTFLMQLDSELPTQEGGELLFGSGGICYIFWCNQSKVSGYVTQCT